MGLNKTTTIIDDWQLVSKDAVLEGATHSVAGAYGATLNINHAPVFTTKHSGTRINIQTSSNTTGDENWHTFKSILSSISNSFVTTTGTTADAGETVLVIADGFDIVGFTTDEVKWIYLQDVDDIEDSEIALLVSHVPPDTSITIQDGLTNAKQGIDAGTSTDKIWSEAETWTINLPLYTNRVRIVYDNTFGANSPKSASDVHVFSRITTVADI